MSERRVVMLITAGPVGSVPSPAGSGAAMGTWAIARMLCEDGHDVCVCHVPLLRHRPTADEQKELASRLARLAERGVAVDIVPVSQRERPKASWNEVWQTVRALVAPRVADFYPYAVATAEVHRTIEARRPDAIYHMHTNTVVTTHEFGAPPRLVMTGDLDDLMLYYRWRLTSLWPPTRYVYRMAVWLSARKLHPTLMHMLQSCQVVVSVAHHVLPIFERESIPCIYVPNPWATNVVDPVCLTQSLRETTRKPRLLMIGHLAGTATLSGLYFLADQTLPHLERLLGPDGFEIHIIGRDELPRDLVRSLQRPSIRLRGYVDDLPREYSEADLMLVPTPFVVGARTRIAEAFSFGCCVVAHAANAPGMPEIVSGQNALLASDGRSLAEAVVRAVRDQALRRRLQENGRATWERYYTPNRAIRRIVDELERIAATETRPRRAVAGVA